MYFVVVARPRHVLGAVGQRHADGVHARDELAVVAEHVERALAHAGHDPHRHRDVGGVRELDADVASCREPSGPIENGHDVHRAALHRAAEELRRARRASRPGRASCSSGRRRPRFSEQMNVRSSTRATSPGSTAPGSCSDACRRSAAERPRLHQDRQSRSYSSAEPSHQWTPSGWVREATSSTQLSSSLWFVGTAVALTSGFTSEWVSERPGSGHHARPAGVSGISCHRPFA